MACSSVATDCNQSCLGGTGACPSCNGKCSSGCSFCSDSCGTDCQNNCATGCSSCASGCSFSCRFGCSGDCDSGCSGTCKSGCSGKCTGDCTSQCDNGCTAGAMTTVYTRLALNTVIFASDIVDLRDLVSNEVTRRSLTPTDVTINVKDPLLASTMNVIVDNMNLISGVNAQKETQNERVDRASVEELMKLAKALYAANLQ